jgi:hypothetical protein
VSQWSSFLYDGVSFDLSHLNSVKFQYIRAATEHKPERRVTFFMTFSDHCFTEHYGENESWVYQDPRSNGERYFCKFRYELSKHLPDLIKSLLQTNAYLLLTFNKHREQFFYLENEYYGETYRVFFEISAPKTNHADLRLDVKSAYSENTWASPVAGSERYRIWRVIDARLDGITLPTKRKR